MANVAAVLKKDVLTQAAEIINAKAKTLDEKDSKFVRRLKTKGFSPIAVFQASKFYQILNEFDFLYFENLDQEDRAPGSWLFNAKLSTAISFVIATLAVITGTGIVGMLAKGFQPLWLAITAVTIGHLTYKFNFSNSDILEMGSRSMDSLLIMLSLGMFISAGAEQFIPVGASFLVTVGMCVAYIGTAVATYIVAQGWTLHKRFCGYLATQINSRLPMKKLIGKLFPNRNDANGNEDLRVKMFFNTDDLFEKAKKKLRSAGYDPCIASVAGGIAVDRLYLRGVYEKREHEFPSTHNPILYVISPDKKEIAAIRRSGQFPDEEALLAFAEKL